MIGMDGKSESGNTVLQARLDDDDDDDLINTNLIKTTFNETNFTCHNKISRPDHCRGWP